MDESDPGDHVSVPAFKIEDRELPIMLCGSSPFVGMGYFGFRAFDCRIKFYNHPDNMADIFVHFARQGLKGAHVHCYENIVKAVKMAYDVETFSVIASLVPKKDTVTQLKTLSKLETAAVFVDASLTDAADEKRLQALTKEIRNSGMIPGLATYQPGITIPRLEGMDIDFSAYLVPLNKTGRYMRPSKDMTLKAVTQTRRVIIAIRPLAAGRILPEEGFPFVMEHCHGFCVGFTSKDEIDDAFQVFSQLRKR